MLKRCLGRTGLDVSVLGLGCAALGGMYRDIAESDAIHTVHTALELGVNYFDTAPYYGLTRSERVLGRALRGIPREQYVISSKVGRYGDNDHDFSYRRVRKGIEESLSRLGCGYLDLAILHDIEFVPLEDVAGEGLRALEDARADGLVRWIGASGLPLSIYPALLEAAHVDVVLSYANYTLQNRGLEEMLPLFEKRRLGVISGSPLGLGLLTRQGPQAWHLGSAELKERCREAAAWCSRRGVDIAELGMQFALANPRIHSTLTGAASVDELRRNAACAGKAVDPAIIAAVQRIIGPALDQTWPSGRPEYNQTSLLPQT